jgi:hypothetical protein
MHASATQITGCTTRRNRHMRFLDKLSASVCTQSSGKSVNNHRCCYKNTIPSLQAIVESESLRERKSYMTILLYQEVLHELAKDL